MADENPLVLIGGAPRSGTSMLVRALDSHPRVLMFPVEAGLIQRLALGGEPAEQSGKDLAFTDSDRLLGLADRVERMCGAAAEAVAKQYREVDTARFKRVLLELTEQPAGPPGLEALRALGRAWLEASPHLRDRYGNTKGLLLAFKMPLYSEWLAAGHAGSVHCLGLMRDPVDRYASSKARRLSAGKLREVEPLAEQDYAGFQADMWVASRSMLSKGLAEGWCTVIRYEEWQEAPEVAARHLAAALSIECTPSLLEQSIFGIPWGLPSAYGFDHDARSSRSREAQQAGRDAVLCDDERKYLRLKCDAAFAPSADPEQIAALRRHAGARFSAESQASWQARQHWIETANAAAFAAAACSKSFLDRVRQHRPALI